MENKPTAITTEYKSFNLAKQMILMKTLGTIGSIHRLHLNGLMHFGIVYSLLDKKYFDRPLLKLTYE